MAARMGPLLAGLAALEDVEGFLRRRALVDDRADRADHADGVGGLPDVAPHVDARRSRLDGVVCELERVELRLELRASRHDEGHGATFDDSVKVRLAVVRLHEVRSELRGDARREPEIAGVPLLQLFPDRVHREDRQADFLALVDEMTEVHEALVLVRRSDENREGDRGGVQADGLAHRGRDLLVGQVLVEDARAAGHPQDDRDVRAGVDRGPHDAPRDHHRIRVGQERLQRLTRNLDLARRPEEVPVVRGEHDGVAVRRPDDPSQAVLKSPGHCTPDASWRASDSMSALKPFLPVTTRGSGLRMARSQAAPSGTPDWLVDIAAGGIPPDVDLLGSMRAGPRDDEYPADLSADRRELLARDAAT